MAVNIAKTFGAVLIGGLFASILSGIVAVQVAVYLNLYPNDAWRNRALVFLVWMLDISHTSFIWISLWGYFIAGFGHAEGIDHILWTVAVTIALTAVLTFAVHCFLAHRILILSQRNVYLTGAIVFLAVLRLVSACATTAEMIHLHSFHEFRRQFQWLFALGLALSTCTDIIITCSLFFLLHTGRSSAPSLSHVINSLIKYAFETGALTCAGTIVSMVCYVSMRDNLIFLALHFVISKFYATSLLVTLNTRKDLRRSQTSPGLDYPITSMESRLSTHKRSSESPDLEGHYTSSKGFRTPSRPVEISVDIETRRRVETSHLQLREHEVST